METCIIAPEAVGPFPNGGIGTHCTNLAIFLSSQLGAGKVTLLYTGKIERLSLDYWRSWYAEKYGVDFAWIDPRTAEAEYFPVIAGLKTRDDLTSYAVLEYLTAHHFDLCFFQEMLGAGFRSIQAKKTGLALQRSLLTCMVHSSTRWVHEAMKMQTVNGVSEMLVMYMERYSVEHCDVFLSPSQYMLDWSLEEVGALPAERHIVSYLSGENLAPVGAGPASNKLIFFGRLEQRKGFVLFLEALLILVREQKVTLPLEVHLLGKMGLTLDGNAQLTLTGYASHFGSEVKIHCVNDLGHDEAIDYLKLHHDAVVVCPSIIDNSPNAIIEALELGVNLISCSTGGIPELFENHDRLCPPEPAALAHLLTRALNNELPPVAARYTPARAVSEWSATLKRLEALAARDEAPRPSPKLKVVMVAEIRNPGYAKQRAALAAQTWQNFGVVEVPNRKAARNLDDSYGLVVLPLECLPRPDALERLAAALQNGRSEVVMGWARLTLTFGLGNETIYRPFGAVHEAAIYGNTLGVGLLAYRPGAPVDFKEDVTEYLFSTQNVWLKMVSMIVLKARSFDVIPAELCESASAPFWMFANQRTYDEQRAVVDALTASLPRWQKRLVESACGAELRAASIWTTVRKQVLAALGW